MSKSSKKGHAFEQELLEDLLKVHRNAYRPRLRGINDKGDFDGIGYQILEAKKHDKWRLTSWIRDVYRKVEAHMPGARWAIALAGDRRTLPGTFVLMPWEQYLEYQDFLIDGNDENLERLSDPN